MSTAVMCWNWHRGRNTALVKTGPCSVQRGWSRVRGVFVGVSVSVCRSIRFLCQNIRKKKKVEDARRITYDYTLGNKLNIYGRILDAKFSLEYNIIADPRRKHSNCLYMLHNWLQVFMLLMRLCQFESEGFWRWCLILWITGFPDFVHLSEPEL
jgi:hypothetical protein